MKKTALILVILLTLSAFCLGGCGKSAELVYHSDGIDIEEKLTAEETNEIIKILDDKKQSDNGDPMCGFDKEISLRVDGKTYAPAQDECAIIMDCDSGQYYEISEDGKDIIEDIFEKHGAKLPYCI